MNRRGFMAGTAMLASASLLPSGALGVDRGQRRFRVLRDGKDIGTHNLSATLGSQGFEIEIRIDLAVKFLGLTAYVYNLINREVWRDGRIVSVNSRVNDDGAEEFCQVTNDGELLQVRGSRFTGTLPLDAVTTSYFHTDFLDRRPWVSTQSGAALAVDVAASGGGRYAVTGELETTLLYDDRGEWMGSIFDAGGETATYELTSETGVIAPLWSAA